VVCTSIGKGGYVSGTLDAQPDIIPFPPKSSMQKKMDLFFRRSLVLKLVAANWGNTCFFIPFFSYTLFSACPLSVGSCESQMILLFFMLCFPRPTQFKQALSVNNTVKSYLVCCVSVEPLPIYFYTNFEKLLNIKTRAGTNLFGPEQFNIYLLPHFQVL
jgi:hypothetical protein